MRGLYLNIQQEKKIYDVLANLDITYNLYEFKNNQNKGILIYDPNEWVDIPFYKDDETLLVVSGWFIYKNKKNNISQLANDFKAQGFSVFNDIEGGIFIIYLAYKGDVYIINDYLSLSMHFVKDDECSFVVAPSPYFFENKKSERFEKLQILPILSSNKFLKKLQESKNSKIT
jgi:hypothetical protein